MAKQENILLSVVVPLYNENIGLPTFHESLLSVLKDVENADYEVIYVDDGSSDGTSVTVKQLCEADEHVRLICLSRNFGKEIATTAGIHEAHGAAIITLDADGQHPVELIPDFIGRWRAGSKVVIGLRSDRRQAELLKRIGSKLFYMVMNWLADVTFVPGATDFRLIDRSVQREFVRMTEHGRITRGLIDWLGYDKTYVTYQEKPRLRGQATNSFRKLTKLFIDSIISLSVSPLFIAAYIGAVVLPISVLVGLVMIVNALIGDPLQWHATGSAYVIMLLLFLVGILLVSQGIIGMYLSHIHTETQNRPLYIVDKANSIGVKYSDSET